MGLFGHALAAADECKEAYSLAAALQNNGLFEEAYEEWQNVVKVCRDDLRLRRAKRHAAVCLFQLKKFKDAGERLQQLLNNELAKDMVKPADIRERQEAMLCLAACHLRLKNEEAAANLLAIFEKEFPDQRELAEMIRRGETPANGIDKTLSGGSK
jgi:TolA-binding protein